MSQPGIKVWWLTTILLTLCWMTMRQLSRRECPSALGRNMTTLKLSQPSITHRTPSISSLMMASLNTLSWKISIAQKNRESNPHPSKLSKTSKSNLHLKVVQETSPIRRTTITSVRETPQCSMRTLQRESTTFHTFLRQETKLIWTI